MGTLWVVWPLGEVMNEWLESEGVEPPQLESRFPTGREIINTLNSLAEYEVKFNDNGINATWQAYISSKNRPEEYWTLLNISQYTGADLPQELCFEKGHEELIRLILKKLTQYCGPLVLVADSGGEPQLINA